MIDFLTQHMSFKSKHCVFTEIYHTSAVFVIIDVPSQYIGDFLGLMYRF